MRAIDVMTSDVITVAEDASVQELAKLLVAHGISAVPVVDKDNRMIGIVSEGDLLHRSETGTEQWRSWWLEMTATRNQLATEYIKSHSGKVMDIMTRNVISVTEETAVADIAVLLETFRIKQLPLLRDGKLVGIVSRSDLVRALATTPTERSGGTEVDDSATRAAVLAELKAQKWTDLSPANITVEDGVVHLWSSYFFEEERRALVVAARKIAGARRVEDHMRRAPTSPLV